MRSQAIQRGWMAAVALATLLASVFVTGCDDVETSNAAPGMLSPSASSDATATGIPTMGEIESALELTPPQAAALQPALATWQSAMEERRARFGDRAGGQRGPRGDRGGRRGQGGGFGPGQGRGPGSGQGPGFGQGSGANFPEGEPPLQTFLSACADVLETEQFVKLAELISEKRAECQSPGRGMRGGHGAPMFMPMMRFARELDLEQEQVQQIRAFVPEIAESARDLFSTYAEGTITLDALRDGIREIRIQIETRLQDILEADQLTQLEELIAEHQAEMAERRLEKIDEGSERKADFLTRVLDLTDAQQEQLGAALAEATARMETLLQAIGAGDVEIEDAITTRIEIREETDTAIRAFLTDEQIAVFDALQELRRGHRGWMAHRL